MRISIKIFRITTCVDKWIFQRMHYVTDASIKMQLFSKRYAWILFVLQEPVKHASYIDLNCLFAMPCTRHKMGYSGYNSVPNFAVLCFIKKWDLSIYVILSQLYKYLMIILSLHTDDFWYGTRSHYSRHLLAVCVHFYGLEFIKVITLHHSPDYLYPHLHWESGGCNCWIIRCKIACTPISKQSFVFYHHTAS